MSAALEMIMVLSKLNNLHSFIDRINCYKQAFRFCYIKKSWYGG